MYGCELRDDGSITGYYQDGYDGKELLALDTQTSTFVATMAQAQITTQRWNSLDVHKGERYNLFLENYCITLLKKHVEDGREDLERRVRPQVKVSGQEKGDTMKLHCQVYGFHPRAVDVKWMNGEDEVHLYETTRVLPNPDGTYQIRVSAEVTPKEGDKHSCKVDHSSLEEPLLVQWEPQTSTVWVIAVAIIVGVVILGIVGFLLYKSSDLSCDSETCETVEIRDSETFIHKNSILRNIVREWFTGKVQSLRPSDHRSPSSMQGRSHYYSVLLIQHLLL
ncbi:class I histocompatibility antigen, F10 alpha chain-like [Phyllobates terribilis]|uniref:class I histocompatibility antigen, F10 alpha chain-like n=1 Tax=Phyllobates terribilis TaxID=111132 RepID=UPI003CCB66F3